MGVRNQKATFPGEVSEDPVERGRWYLTKELRHLYLVIFMFLFSVCAYTKSSLYTCITLGKC